METTAIYKLILFGGLSSVLILLFLLRKFISLSFIILTKGLYSYNYLQKYRTYYARNPFQGCIREDLITRIEHLMVKNNCIKTLKTKKEILFEGEKFGQTFKALHKKFGDPICFTAHKIGDPGFIIKMAGFESSGYVQNVTPLYYFIDDQFFMGEYLIKNPKEGINVIDLLKDWYEVPISSSDGKFVIENSAERTVHFHDTGFSVNLKFFSSEVPEVNYKLNNYREEVRARHNTIATSLEPMLARF